MSNVDVDVDVEVDINVDVDVDDIVDVDVDVRIIVVVIVGSVGFGAVPTGSVLFRFLVLGFDFLLFGSWFSVLRSRLCRSSSDRSASCC